MVRVDSNVCLWLKDLPATILAGLHVDMMGAAALTALLVFDVRRSLESIGGAAEAPLHG